MSEISTKLEAAGLRVRGLHWARDYVNKEWHGNVIHNTGPHYLVKDDGRWCVNEQRRWVLEQVGNVDAAMKAAEADYTSRILAALEAAP